MQRVRIYTDGGCLQNRRRRKGNRIGAWAAVLHWGKVDTEGLFTLTDKKRIGGAYADTTNNRMEMTAAIRGLEALQREGVRVEVYSDSQYLVLGMTEWMDRWVRDGSLNSGGVANNDLWQRLIQLTYKHRVTWAWVRGHAGHPQNEEADALVTSLMRRVKEGEATDLVSVEEG